MSHFFDRFFRKKKKKEDDNASIFYYDENGFAFSVTLICSCQNPLKITSVDENFEPSIPHFECEHCDRVCKQRKCETCMVYSEMTNARLAMEE